MLISNLYIFIIWWMFFSCFHYFISKISGNDESLSPPLGLATIVIVLYLSGMYLNTLIPGFWFIFSLGIFGLFWLIYEKKLLFWKEFVFPPYSLLLFNFLALLFFLQSIYLSNGFSSIDDKQHWAIIMNGMCHSQKLNGFPRLYGFDNYTLGTAIWGYFINKLSFSKFRLDIANWSYVLISLACFIPSLNFFKFGRGNVPKYIPFLLALFIYLYSFFNDYYLIISLTICLFICFYTVLKKANVIAQTSLFASWFLLFSFLLISPSGGGTGFKSIYGDFRAMPPEHVIFVTSISAFFVYLLHFVNRSKRKFSNLFLAVNVSLILSLSYIFKKPGLFFAIAIGTIIIIHFSALRFNLIISLLKRAKFLKIGYLLLLLVCIVFSLILPPLLWNSYCVSHKRINSHPANYIPINYSSIKKCFFEKEDPIFAKTRDKFLDKFINLEIFRFSHTKNSSSSSSSNNGILRFFKINQIVKATYPNIIIFIVFLSITLTIILWHNTKIRKSYLIFLTIIFFLFLHIAGLLVTYCIHFGITSEKYLIPSYARYASPMIKLTLAIVFVLGIIAVSNIKAKYLKLVLSLLCLFSAILFNYMIGLKLYSKSFPKPFVKSLYRTSCFPNNFDFNNNKLLVLGYWNEAFEELGSILMLYPYSSPSFVKMLEYNNYKKYLNYELTEYNYDYLWWQQEDYFYNVDSLTNNIPKALTALVDDVSCLNNSCLFRIEKNKKSVKLKLVYMDCSHTNIFNKNEFQNNLKDWECSNANFLKMLDMNDQIGVCLSAQNGNNEYCLAKKVVLEGETFYHFICDIDGSGNSAFARLGNCEIYPSEQNKKKLDYYLYCNETTNVFVKLIPDKKQDRAFWNIKLINLGCLNRNKNERLKLYID